MNFQSTQIEDTEVFPIKLEPWAQKIADEISEEIKKSIEKMIDKAFEEFENNKRRTS